MRTLSILARASILVGALASAMSLSLPAVAMEPIVGRASVIDGDTIDVHGIRIRLFGIDAPESSQSCEDASGQPYRCGKVAADALDNRLLGKVVTCEPRDQDRYGRVVAVCREGGIDLNRWLVSQGLAPAYTRYGADYARDESEARGARRGVWAGRFQTPSEYRASNRREGGGYQGYQGFQGYQGYGGRRSHGIDLGDYARFGSY